MNDDRVKQRSAGFPKGTLSDAKVQELNEIREAIMSRARRTVDPNGTGFDAVMMSDDSSFFNTDEDDPRDWLEWGERFLSIVSLVSQRVSLAIASAGFAIAGATMIGTERGGSLGLVSMAVAGVFGAWFAAVTAMGARRR